MRKKPSLYVSILGLIIIVLVTACSGSSPTTGVQVNTPGKSVTESIPTISSTSANTGGFGYPAPGEVINTVNPYPAPAGETSITPLPKGELPTPPKDAPQPAEGMASISGTIFSFTSRMVVPDTLFYLTPGWGADHKENPLAFAGPNEKNGDVRLKTDDKGDFSADSIPPGNYYLAVWAPYNWVESVNSPTDLNPFLIQVQAGQKYPLGVVYVSWP